MKEQEVNPIVNMHRRERRTIWRRISLVGVAIAFGCCPLSAQYDDTKVLPFEFTPQVSIRTTMSFHTEPGVDGMSSKVVLESGPSKALSFGVRLNDEDLVEIRWARQDTQVRVTGPAITPFKQSVTLDQFHLDCSHEYIVPEWPEWARPYIMGSVGVTHISGTAGFVSFSRFSFGIGGGVKAFPFRHLGFKAQAQWVTLWVNPEVDAYCGVGCIIHIGGKLSSQGEVIVGPVFRF